MLLLPLRNKAEMAFILGVIDGADGGGRTHTLLRVPDFESSASANSATSALLIINRLRRYGSLRLSLRFPVFAL